MATLSEQPGIAARALAFTILTASRTDEVLSARWHEIDLTATVWTVPAARMKANREHRVPPSAPTLEILHEVAELRSTNDPGGFVFPQHLACRAAVEHGDDGRLAAHEAGRGDRTR